MTRSRPAWAKREFERAQRYGKCEARGYHVRGTRIEDRPIGGKGPFRFVWCVDCDVGIMADDPRWR